MSTGKHFLLRKKLFFASRLFRPHRPTSPGGLIFHAVSTEQGTVLVSHPFVAALNRARVTVVFGKGGSLLYELHRIF